MAGAGRDVMEPDKPLEGKMSLSFHVEVLRLGALIAGILTCCQVIQIVQDGEMNIVCGLLVIIISFLGGSGK